MWQNTYIVGITVYNWYLRLNLKYVTFNFNFLWALTPETFMSGLKRLNILCLPRSIPRKLTEL